MRISRQFQSIDFKLPGYIIAVLNLFKSIHEIYDCWELLGLVNGPCEKFQKWMTEDDPDFNFPDERCELFATGKNWLELYEL